MLRMLCAALQMVRTCTTFLHMHEWPHVLLHAPVLEHIRDTSLLELLLGTGCFIAKSQELICTVTGMIMDVLGARRMPGGDPGCRAGGCGSREEQ